MAARGELVGLLGRVAFFEGLDRKELAAVLRSADEVTHAEGHEIVREGQEGGAGFHLILEGRCGVIQGGRRKHELGPGEYFGEIALIDGGPRSATIVAETPVRTLSIVAWNFKPLLEEHPSIAYKLLVVLCGRLRAAEKAALTV